MRRNHLSVRSGGYEHRSMHHQVNYTIPLMSRTLASKRAETGRGDCEQNRLYLRGTIANMFSHERCTHYHEPDSLNLRRDQATLNPNFPVHHISAPGLHTQHRRRPDSHPDDPGVIGKGNGDDPGTAPKSAEFPERHIGRVRRANNGTDGHGSKVVPSASETS